VLKRCLDVIVAACVLVVLSPVLAVLAMLIRRKLGSPVLFRQPRIGLGNTEFELVKFRSMSSLSDAQGKLLPDAQRMTPFGGWLRSTSLDELPTLWNVLCGHMSLVGPRPLIAAYLPLYSDLQKRRHEVKPGVTGWAQVNGRNTLSWERKFALDVWYVDNRSLRLDVRILFMTVVKVLRRDGINAEGSATMPVFTGSGKESSRQTIDASAEAMVDE